MVTPVAALGGVGQRQQIALVTAHQLLQARGPRAGIDRRGAGDVVRLVAAIFLCFRQPLVCQQAKDVRGGGGLRLAAVQLRGFAIRQQGEIEQAVGVVVGGAEQLSTGDIFIHCRNAPLEAHIRRIQRLTYRQLCQRGAVGTQQEDGFDVIAAGLFQRQRRQLAVGNAAFGHDPVDGKVELLFYLGDAQLGKLLITPASVFLQGMGGGDRLLAPFDGNVHQHTSTWVVRGIASRRSPQVNSRSIPSGKGCGRSVSS